MLFAIDIDGTILRLKNRQSVPFPCAVKVLTEMARKGTLIYTTCRPESRRQESIDWLSQYRFPNPERVYCCAHYRYKLLTAFEHASSDEQVTVIDDLYKEIIHGFRQIVRDDRETAIKMSKRMALIRYGSYGKLPDLGIKIPFPCKSMPSWRWLLTIGATTAAAAQLADWSSVRLRRLAALGESLPLLQSHRIQDR